MAALCVKRLSSEIEMTDKDNMREEFEAAVALLEYRIGRDEVGDYARADVRDMWALWQQSAKESSSKELEAANLRIAKLTDLGIRLVEREQDLLVREEALEQKLAERDDEADSLIGMQQIRIQELENSAAIHQANIELLATGVDDFWLAEHGHLFDDNGIFIGDTDQATRLNG
jgi:hypothetical protein